MRRMSQGRWKKAGDNPQSTSRQDPHGRERAQGKVRRTGEGSEFGGNALVWQGTKAMIRWEESGDWEGDWTVELEKPARAKFRQHLGGHAWGCGFCFKRKERS